jgi:hypothetical protein
MLIRAKLWMMWAASAASKPDQSIFILKENFGCFGHVNGRTYCKIKFNSALTDIAQPARACPPFQSEKPCEKGLESDLTTAIISGLARSAEHIQLFFGGKI